MDRLLPTQEGQELVALVREIAQGELAPRAAAAEEAAEFPRDAFALLGEAGVLGMPYPEKWGGSDQPYEVYLQALEEIAAAWMSVGVGVSVHVMTCLALAEHGTAEQQDALMPEMIGGTLLGAYALSESGAGSDIAAMTTRATRTGDEFELNGTKSWISHAGHADYYTTFARTDDDLSLPVSAFLVPADSVGLSFGTPERKMGMNASHTATVSFEGVTVRANRMIGAQGDGLRIALGSLDSGRLGIAACATGLAQAALDCAVEYARERQQFGRAIAEFQGMQFLLADMAAAVDQARAVYLHAARLKDAGRHYSRAAAVAKLTATDAAMKVTTDAVQVLGGYGYTRDFPAERYMREAKVTQIFEGTNQIQRIVIARQLIGSQVRSGLATRRK
ncbi:acyl-CoA dehydrogenase family protein [Propionibacteriaceae bacterium Y1700]|uniref:acyl-CoA dehydrogenase family protein n=1 Tax=Microlunatus sp. Y1700 TaxID=3418487 RepID=UPI003DA77FEB